MMIRSEAHWERSVDDGVMRLHPGYFLAQCPVCKNPSILGLPAFGEMRVISNALHCGRLRCAREMGIETG